MLRSSRLLLPLAFALAFATALLWPGEALAQVTYTVTVATDIDDGACDAHCTLREAINAANAHAGADTIAFALPGFGMSIGTSTPLPTIADAVTIDGYTQSGSSPNTNATGGLNTVVGLELVGGGGPGLAYGLAIDADGVVVKGLVISHYTDAIVIQATAKHVTIAGNFIGPNMTGTAPPGWGASSGGIYVSPGATNITIGGATAADRNLITSHTGYGIAIDRSALDTSVTVQGNLIGTDVTGTQALPSSAPSGGTTIGVLITGFANPNHADTITIGGATAALGNVISGIDGMGINVANDPGGDDPAGTAITIEHNIIGPAADGTTPIGNTVVGLFFEGRASATVRGNTIAYNDGLGIAIQAAGLPAGGHGVVITQNSIHDNAGIGIDLGPAGASDGRTYNDAGDADTGGNALVNFPVIDSARYDPASHELMVQGYYLAEPAAVDVTYTVEAFLNPNGGLARSAYDGTTYLANAPVIVSGSGTATFSFTIPGTFTVGDEISLTATHPDGYTSEFSDAVTIALAGKRISGTVTLPDGRGLEHAQIQITDNNGFTDSADTDSDGGYEFLDLPPATYVLTPAFPGVTFAPPSATVTNLAADTTVDFSANPIAQIYTVNATDDAIDGSCDSLHCSLYEAIIASNRHPGPDTIAFDIQPAGAVHTIGWSSIPPGIEDPVVIDGFTQPGAAPNTNATGGLNAAIKIELAPASPSGSSFGLIIVSPGVTVRGLAIHGFQADIAVANSGDTGVTIAGNYLGTNADGSAAAEPSQIGIITGSNGTIAIGGTTPAARNLISGHNQVGVVLSPGAGVPSTMIVEGNLIGTDITGQQALGNGAGVVVDVQDSTSPDSDLVRIGGEGEAARNVISGNQNIGVVLGRANGVDGPAEVRQVVNNYIGVAANGVTPLPNLGPGVGVYNGVSALVMENLIAHNLGAGVSVGTGGSCGCVPAADGRGVQVSENQIFQNGGEAIDLNEDGRTENDADDSDTGPNDLQNFPVLLTAVENLGGGATVTGELHGEPNTSYRIEAFWTGFSHDLGKDAARFAGTTSGTTDGAGALTFSLTTSAINPPVVGAYLVATATSIERQMTSELSAPIVITAMARHMITGIVRLNGEPLGGVSMQLTGAVTSTEITSLGGGYAFGNLPAPGSYTLTPVLAGYHFDPQAVPLASLPNDTVINFNAIRDITEQFLAEGATGPFWKTSIGILNPEPSSVIANVEFLMDNGVKQTIAVPLTGPGHAVIDPSMVPELKQATFSTIVRAPAKIVASRTMRWGNDGELGAHAEQAVPAPRETWYFAEGATSCFKLFYLLVNPTATQADVTITYARRAPEAPVVLTYNVPAFSRYTVPVNDQPGLKFAEVAAKIEVTNHVPIVAERAMYSSCYGASWRGGHESVGSAAPSTSWYLAEGATGSFFDFYLLIANFEDNDATVDVQYLLPDGSSFTKPHIVPAHSRVTIDVAGEDARLEATSTGAVITSTNTVPVVVERSQWWPHGHWYEGHASAGATQAGVEWQLAGAEAGGARRSHAYLLIANTEATAGQAQVKLVFNDGTTAVLPQPVALAGYERKTLDLGDVFPAALGKPFGVIVESLGATPAPIVVELSIYNSTTLDGADVFWGNGTNVVGTRVR